MDAENCGAIDRGMKVEGFVLPERRGGRVNTLCDGDDGKSGVVESSEDDRSGSINCGGMGGGANSDVKMPKPTER